MLLAENAMGRKRGLDQLADRRFSRLVTFRDRIEPARFLVNDGQS